MFERFTRGARRVVELAQIEARALGHGCIGTEHLVLALVTEDMGVSTAVLNDCGITEEGMKRLLMNFWSTDDLTHQDAEALRMIGIDLDEVRRAVEANFGPGAFDVGGPHCRKPRFGQIPFTRLSKRALERSLQQALVLGHGYIGPEHILLAVLGDRQALGTLLIEESGADKAELQRRLLAEIRRAS